MRVVAYSIKAGEKEVLAIANHKKHEITLISNSLTAETVSFAAGKEAILVYSNDDVSAAVVNRLADLGVKYIATRSTDVSHIDQLATSSRNIKVGNVPHLVLTPLNLEDLPMALAMETINNLDKWQENCCLGTACICAKACDVSPKSSNHLT
ncbi:lactate dehydrogenase-like 2-hydroxyacid dehydrogenase [Pedobacter sp. UYP24]